MPTPEQVKTELQSAGAGRLLLMLINTQTVAAALGDDEHIGMAAQSSHNGTTAVTIATTARILVFGTSPQKLVRDIPYTELSSVECKPGFSSSMITLVVSGRKVEIDKVIDNKRAAALGAYLSTRIGSDRPLEAVAPEPITCPKCGSDQFAANKKGFGLGKAVVGGVLLGPAGLLGGFIGSGKIKVTCVRCGHSWEAGTVK